MVISQGEIRGLKNLSTDVLSVDLAVALSY